MAQITKADDGQLGIFEKEVQVSSKTYTRVSQSNALARYPLNLSLYASRIFVLMLRHIHKNDKSFPPISIPDRDVLMGGYLNKKQRDAITKACVEILDVLIDMRPYDDKTGVDGIRLVDALRYRKNDDVIVGSFSNSIREHLLDLAERYTYGEVEDLLKIRNPHTHRFYWLFMSWVHGKTKVGHMGPFPVESVRNMVVGKTKSYDVYGKFKQNVLGPALDELEKMGFTVSCQEKKTGKRVTALFFELDMNKKMTVVEAEVQKIIEEMPVVREVSITKPVILTELENKLTQRLAKVNLTEPQISKILDMAAKNNDVLSNIMRLTYPFYQEVVTKHKTADSVAPNVVNLLKLNYPNLYPKQ